MYSNVFKVHNSDMMYRTRCYIFFILFIRVVLCDDNRFFGVGDSGSDIVCYTNSSYALSWNEDLNTWEKGGIVTPDKQISVFDPVLKKNYLNCSLSSNENMFCLDSWTNYAWKYVNSIKNNLKEVILDKRWEDLEMYTTLGDNDEIQVTPELDGNFIIPFSIRIKNNGHIFLCDDVKRSNCYWLTLQVLETHGKISTCIRKCKRNSSGQSEPCTANFNRNPKNYSTFLDGKLWRHFLLRKVKNQIIFSQGGPQQNTILNYTDYNSPYINVRYLFISSSNTTGLWKIHDYSYMNTDQIYSMRLFEFLRLPAYSLCISMYIRTCRFCILRLQLGKDNILIYEPVYYVTRDSKWTEITFKVAGLTSPGPFHLLVSTVVEVYWHDSIQSFWSIGTVRTCQQNEFRIIKTKNKAAVCQLMSEEPLAYIPKTVNETCRLDQHSSCHPDNKSTNSNSKFSPSCVVHSKNDFVATPYSTSIHISIQQCLNNCKTLKYQIDFCGQKYDVYSNTTQLERAQLNPLTNCNITVHTLANFFFLTVQTLAEAPGKIQNLESRPYTRRIFLRWEEPTTQYNTIKNYELEYWHVKYLSCAGIETKKSTKEVTNTTYIWITNLFPYSMYAFKIAAVNNNKFIAEYYEHYQTTLPLNVSKQKLPRIIKIKPFKESMEVHFSVTKCEHITGEILLNARATCISVWCQANNDVSQKLNITADSSINRLHFKNLQPYSNYTISTEICRNKDCVKLLLNTTQTLSAAPGPVTSLTVYSKGNDYISVRWLPPYPPNGILDRYKIYLNREEKTQLETVLCSPFHCATFNNLKPADYEIKVYPINKRSLTGNVSIIHTTIEIEVSDPYDISGNWTDLNDLIISWKHPNEVNGEISKFVIYLNNSEPIDIPIQSKNYNLTYSHTIKSTALNSSTLYGIQIETFNGIAGRKSEVKWLTSPPPLPHIDHEIICERDTQTAKLTLNVMLEKGSKLLIKIENVLSDAKSQICDEFELAVSCECGNSTNSYNIKTLYLGQDNDNLACTDINNGPLDIEKNYRVAVILVNSFHNQTRQRCQIHDVGSIKTNRKLFVLFIFPIIFLIVAIKIIIKENAPTVNKVNLEAPEPTPIVIDLDELQESSATTTLKITKSPANGSCVKYSNCIKVREFEDYIREALEDGSLEREHESLASGKQKPCSYGALSINKKKNRYKNILAYDDSRVVLQTSASTESDYINANYINGYQMPRAFIATQGPLKKTIEDFYQMIWQENVGNIVMVANLIENGSSKVEQYWPEVNECLLFGKYTVGYISHEKFLSYDVRTFSLAHNRETRRIQQWHFSCWPDHGVPLYRTTLQTFLLKLLAIPLNSQSPIVVHCSAGIGRTGTTLLCLICLQMAAQEGEVDPLKILASMRASRINMINEVSQYKLAHLVILQSLSAQSTEIPCVQMPVMIPHILESNTVAKQMKHLRETAWQDVSLVTPMDIETEPGSCVPEKNRFRHIFPKSHERIYICRYPTYDATSSYINAIRVDDFQTPRRFIVTQQPLPNTVGDFWRLVEENEVTVIVNLNEINPQDSTTCAFWPDETNVVLNPVDYISIKYQKTDSQRYYKVVKTKVFVKGKEPREVLILSMKKWFSSQDIPSLEEYLVFFLDIHRFTVNSSPIVVTCHDGVTASGLFVATSFIIERMKLEHVCDVCEAVRTVRYNRSEFISGEIQFCFLYKVALEYLNEFEGYANLL